MRRGRQFEDGMFVRRREASRSAAGPSLLWIHGLGESGLCFAALADARVLAGREQLVPDLPGYGRSAPERRPLSLAGAADRLARWLDSGGRSPVVVVGHSMGAIVGLLLAERRPELVAALVDVDGNKSEQDCGYSGPAARVARSEFEAGGTEALSREVGALADGDPALLGYAESLRMADPAQFHAHACELVELSKGERLAPRLAALARPKLFVAGVPRGVSARSLDLVREAGVPLEVVEPSGHWPFIDRPVEFAGLLERFVRALP